VIDEDVIVSVKCEIVLFNYDKSRLVNYLRC